MACSTILVIDDEPALRQILSTVLTRAGYSVRTASGTGEAISILARGDTDVALCDIKMPDGNGIELLKQARAAGIDTTFIMITAIAAVETAVEALRAGASDYIVKPVRNEELLHRIEQIESVRGLREENKLLRRAAREKSTAQFRFASAGMLHVEHLVDKVAPTNSTVLIVGESGTGKGVLAQSIHQKSARSEQAFVSVNCSAIPEQLIESEFFGHTRGAFTGADRARKGLFVEANRGTLFLDEIGELSLPMQTKLLHAIEDKHVRAVGSEQSRVVDVRIVAATNRDLTGMVAQDTFREDLYFRLSMFQIAIPPLRERQADIRALLQFFMQAGRNGSGVRALELDPDAEAFLMAHRWPGNVRELENVINRARILAEGDRITVADLPMTLVRAVDPTLMLHDAHPPGESLREQMQRVELDIIQQAIRAAKGDRKLAAQRLAISLSSLYRKLEEPAIRGRAQPSTVSADEA